MRPSDGSQACPDSNPAAGGIEAFYFHDPDGHVLELIEFRGIAQSRYAPKFQDIGFGHVAFRTDDIAGVTATMQALGAEALSGTGTWTQINDSTRAVYTQDPNGLFIEVIE